MRNEFLIAFRVQRLTVSIAPFKMIYNNLKHTEDLPLKI